MAQAHEAQEQIAFADIILLNKIDNVSSEEVQALEKRIRSISMFRID
ncbi:GTP-binding protein [Alteribacillus sp. HJP-4]